MSWSNGINLDQIRAKVRAGANKGLDLAAEHVLGVSNAHVPIEEDTLERSGKTSADGLRRAVSYDTPYAVVQHEDMSLRHDPGRTSKYLENALNSERQTVGQIVAQSIRSELGT